MVPSHIYPMFVYDEGTFVNAHIQTLSITSQFNVLVICVQSAV